MSRAAASLIALFVALVLVAGYRKSETFDEGLFIAGGVAQVEHGNPNIDLMHPPLLRWIAGIPAILPGRARLPSNPPWVVRRDLDLEVRSLTVFPYAVSFFYDANSHDRVLFWGRFPFAFLGALLGWLVFSTCRGLFGPWPALGALALFLFTPEVLAHSQWAHSDLASALTIFVVAIALERALREPSTRAAALLGGALGIAAATKITAILVVLPVLLLLAAFHRGNLRSLAGRMAIVAGALFAVIAAAYLPRPRLFGHEFLPGDLEKLGVSALAPVLRVLPLPDTFLKGLVCHGLIGQHGQTAFFHGQVSAAGWWYYFPAAIFLKYPTPLLLLGLAGLAVLWRGGMPLSSKFAWTVPPLTILAAAMAQSEDIGVRSVLALAPFLALWSAAAFDRFRRGTARGAAVLLLGASVASGILAFPNFLSYFNPLMGGNRAADKWLADSNLDWGQDLPALAKELNRRGISSVRLDYFGRAQPSHWGIAGLDPTVVAPGWYAISRTSLSGMWTSGDPYWWLRRFEPEAIPGGSISLYRVTRAQLEALERDLMAEGLKALTGNRDPGRAAESFSRVLRLNPVHYGATFQLARALDDAGRPGDARPVWFQMLTLAQSAKDEATVKMARDRLSRSDAVTEETLMHLGLDSLYRLGDPAGAATRFQEVLRRNPGHYGALFQLASALDRAGHRAEARPYWDKVLAAAVAYRDEGTARTARERLRAP